MSIAFHTKPFLVLHMKQIGYTLGMHTQIVGRDGEDAAALFLQNQGFSITERNYSKKWGELDIIAQKAKKLHFVEVKAVTHETKGFSPEDRVHKEKLKRMGRTIETYLLERNVPHETDFQIDVLSVYLSPDPTKTRFDYIPDVYIE